MRHWGWGRNDETWGECPTLTAAYAKAIVRGLQGTSPPTSSWSWSSPSSSLSSAMLSAATTRSGTNNSNKYVAVTAGCKHFGVGSGPDSIPVDRRFFDANVSLRDWATTFLPAFQACVQAGALGVMCSFNAVRGVPACASHRGMTTWLRDEWNYEGYTVSDQGAAYGIYSDHK